VDPRMSATRPHSSAAAGLPPLAEPHASSYYGLTGEKPIALERLFAVRSHRLPETVRPRSAEMTLVRPPPTPRQRVRV